MSLSEDSSNPDTRTRFRNKVQEEHLVTIKDDSTGIPPSTGTPSWMGILGGSMLGQPASRFTTFEHKSTPILFAPWFWIALIVGGFLIYTVASNLFY